MTEYRISTQSNPEGELIPIKVMPRPVLQQQYQQPVIQPQIIQPQYQQPMVQQQVGPMQPQYPVQQVIPMQPQYPVQQVIPMQPQYQMHPQYQEQQYEPSYNNGRIKQGYNNLKTGMRKKFGNVGTKITNARKRATRHISDNKYIYIFIILLVIVVIVLSIVIGTKANCPADKSNDTTDTTTDTAPADEKPAEDTFKDNREASKKPVSKKVAPKKVENYKFKAIDNLGTGLSLDNPNSTIVKALPNNNLVSKIWEYNPSSYSVCSATDGSLCMYGKEGEPIILKPFEDKKGFKWNVDIAHGKIVDIEDDIIITNIEGNKVIASKKNNIPNEKWKISVL